MRIRVSRELLHLWTGHRQTPAECRRLLNMLLAWFCLSVLKLSNTEAGIVLECSPKAARTRAKNFVALLVRLEQDATFEAKGALGSVRFRPPRSKKVVDFPFIREVQERDPRGKAYTGTAPGEAIAE
jgi:hypothetical protein